MALETEDMKQITDAVLTILNGCIMTKGVKIEDLPSFDIEYLFLNVRAKSVGEKVEVNLTCPDDNVTSVTIDIDLDSIKVKKDKNHKKIVKLDDNLSLKLKYPTMDTFINNNFESNDDADIKTTLKLITTCIDIIYNEEESWTGSDSTEKELIEFVEQLNTKQFQLIENFFSTMPKLTHSVKIKNPKTNVESTVILEGLASFFN